MTTDLNQSNLPEIDDDVIDSHHKEVFHLVSELDNALHRNDRDKLLSIVRFLETYTMDHFEEEETLMKEAQFEGLQYHQNEHNIFRSKINGLQELVRNNAPTTHLMLCLRQFVDRLVDHILTVDSEMSGLGDH